MTDLDDLPTYEIQPNFAEWVGGITVAQFDESPAIAYKVTAYPVTEDASNPDDAPDKWVNGVTAYDVMGVWVGRGGTIDNLTKGVVYFVAETQRVNVNGTNIWAQFRKLGVLKVA